RHVVHLRGLPAAFAGLRVVQLSDIHHGLYMPLQAVERAVEAANALQPDVAALTGDFVTFSREYVAPVARSLSRLRASLGIFAVLGNHDFRVGADLVTSELCRNGLQVLRNSHALLSRGEQHLLLAGVDDLWYGCDLPRAVRGAPGSGPRILLSHNPAIL